MKKGLHIIRALFPEVQPAVCWWCGGSIKESLWVGQYRPVFNGPGPPFALLCWDCAHRCSQLAGQPRVPYHFASEAHAYRIAL